MPEPAPQAQRGNSYGSSGTTGNYEDRFMPSDNAYGGGGRSEKPFVAATSPWASSESEFSGVAYGSGRPRPVGLPRGPAPNRR